MNRPIFFQRFLVAVCLFSNLFLFGQKPKEVTIEGTALFAANYEIRAITFSDYINFNPTVSAATKIAKSGAFKLSFKTNTIQLVQIEINTSRSEFFVVPGYNYNLSITMDEQLFKMFNPSDENGFLLIRSNQIDTNDLNYKIIQFTNYYEQLLEKYANNITRFRRIQDYDSLIFELKERFPLEYNPTNFYLSYIYYTIGQLDAIVNYKDARMIYSKYFDNDYILYDNPAYMTMFNYFYDNYLYLSPRISKTVLDNVINEKCDYLALFNAVGKDFSLVNERLRELVIIKNLSQFVGNREFNQENVFKLLNYISTNTRFIEHKKIAEASLTKSTKLDSGSSIPNFNFKFANGSKFDPSDFEGKWVYYHFFSVKCVDCIREMALINELQKQHINKIVFVSVCVDPDVTKFVQFRKKYSQFDWPFVHFNQSYEWLKNIEIVSLPEYLLVSPDGTLFRRYPPAPDRDLPILLLQLLEEEEEIINPLDPRNQK